LLCSDGSTEELLINWLFQLDINPAVLTPLAAKSNGDDNIIVIGIDSTSK